MSSGSRTSRVTVKVTHPDGSVERYEKKSEDDGNGNINMTIFGRYAGGLTVHTTSSPRNSISGKSDRESDSESVRLSIDD
jgi:hypothetical protein